MGTLFSGLLSGASSIFGGVWGYVGVGVIALGVGLYGGYRVELGSYETLVAQNATAKTKVAQVRTVIVLKEDKAAEADAIAEAVAQQKIADQKSLIPTEVTKYVPVIKSCVPVGLVRVLNAHAIGIDPTALSIAGGEPDDACAPITWDSFAADIADDYDTARANGEQLNALEADITRIHTAATPDPTTTQ